MLVQGPISFDDVIILLTKGQYYKTFFSSFQKDKLERLSLAY
jgi:hypothetical protein